MRLIFFFWAFFLSFGAIAQNKLVVTKLNASQLPTEIKYQGKLKQAVRWADRHGDNIVVISETGIYKNPKFKHENDGSDAEIFAYHYIIKDSIRQTWKIYDFIQDCPVDIEASFIKNTLQVTDLDKDGVGEIWTMYKKACHGDVSPCEMKIIMYQADKKFAIRGQNKVYLSKTESYGGEYKLDQAFKNGPKVFRDFALKLWNKNILQKWDE